MKNGKTDKSYPYTYTLQTVAATIIITKNKIKERIKVSKESSRDISMLKNKKGVVE